jgi:quercetin 2,3-dioxygenase
MLIFPAGSRGKTKTNWLDSNHSFSFGNYYDPNLTNFGTLLVINHDIIAPANGFPKHFHRDMEIITIPLRGQVEHQDSTGAKGIIDTGEVQAMSAGSGIFHSEYNPSDSKDTELLQIWIIPESNGIEPRYSQVKINDIKTFSNSDNTINLRTLASPDGSTGGISIHQQAWLSEVIFTSSQQNWSYKRHNADNLVYMMILRGEVKIGDATSLQDFDAVGLDKGEELELQIPTNSRLLIFEVPNLAN